MLLLLLQKISVHIAQEKEVLGKMEESLCVSKAANFIELFLALWHRVVSVPKTHMNQFTVAPSTTRIFNFLTVKEES